MVFRDEQTEVEQPARGPEVVPGVAAGVEQRDQVVPGPPSGVADRAHTGAVQDPVGADRGSRR